MTADNSAESEVVVLNELGLHARPATLLAKKAMEYKCELYLIKDGESFNIRSVMNILMMAAGKGARIAIRGIGDDADRAVAEIKDMVNSKFGED